MKKLIIIFAAVFCLTGCANSNNPSNLEIEYFDVYNNSISETAIKDISITFDSSLVLLNDEQNKIILEDASKHIKNQSATNKPEVYTWYFSKSFADEYVSSINLATQSTDLSLDDLKAPNFVSESFDHIQPLLESIYSGVALDQNSINYKKIGNLDFLTYEITYWNNNNIKLKSMQAITIIEGNQYSFLFTSTNNLFDNYIDTYLDFLTKIETI